MDPAFWRVANRVPVTGEETTGQMAAIETGVPAVAGAGQVGLLTAGDCRGGTLPPPQMLLEAIEPFGGFGAGGLADAASPGPVSTGPEGPPAPDGEAAEAHAAAATLAPAGRVPCGTGWPDKPRGSGWPGGSLPAGHRGWGEDRAPRGESSCALAGQLGSVPRARDFARSTVCGWGLAHLCDDVTSVVSELVTNALLYGLDEAGTASGAPGTGYAQPGDAAADWAADWPSAPIELRLMLRPADVVCMVADPGTGMPTVTDPEHFAEGGRGLQVVEACSDRWGWDPLAEGGKVVWAAFRR